MCFLWECVCVSEWERLPGSALPHMSCLLPSLLLPFSASYLPSVLVPPPLASPVRTPCLTLNYHSVLLGIALARESRVLAETSLKIIRCESLACSLQRVKQANGKGWASSPTPPLLPHKSSFSWKLPFTFPGWPLSLMKWEKQNVKSCFLSKWKEEHAAVHFNAVRQECGGLGEGRRLTCPFFARYLGT